MMESGGHILRSDEIVLKPISTSDNEKIRAEE